MIKDTPKNGPIFVEVFFPVWIKKFFQKNKTEENVLIYPNYMLQSKKLQYFSFQCCYGMWMFVLCERSFCTVDSTKISKINF